MPLDIVLLAAGCRPVQLAFSPSIPGDWFKVSIKASDNWTLTDINRFFGPPGMMNLSRTGSVPLPAIGLKPAPDAGLTMFYGCPDFLARGLRVQGISDQSMDIMNIHHPIAANEDAPLAFPSLEDSPLWDENFRTPAEPQPEQVPPLQVIRDAYPRIAKAIELMWGTPEMEEYFRRLIVDDRNDRAGFPQPVMAAILTLSADHSKRFAFKQMKQLGENWGSDRFHCFAFK